MPNLSTLTALAGGIPAGAVMSFAMSAAPMGWYPCDGTTVTRTGSGANLFAVIGTIYGVGNGTTTFNVPDYRGEFLRGWDNSRGVDTGRVFGSSQVATSIYNQYGDLRQPANAGVADGEDSYTVNGQVVQVTSATLPTVNRTWTRVRPRNLAVFYCIKL